MVFSQNKKHSTVTEFLIDEFFVNLDTFNTRGTVDTKKIPQSTTENVLMPSLVKRS